MSAHYFVQQGRPRYMPTINIALPWCRRATRKRAPFWARGPLSHPNQQPLRFAWYSCSLPRRHSLMRKTSIPWQGRWFGVNNYCSYSIVYIINIQGLEYIYIISHRQMCWIFFVQVFFCISHSSLISSWPQRTLIGNRWTPFSLRGLRH